MTRSPGYCGVILAAGTPERPSNLGAHIDALNTVSELVLVVAGSDESAITPTVYAHGGYLVVAPETASDFSNIQVGVREVLSRGRDTAIVVPAGLLPLPPAIYRALCETYQGSGRDVWAIVPKCSETSSCPVIAGRELIEQILRAPIESRFGDVLSANAAHVLAVEIDERSVSSTLAQHNS